MTCKHKFIEASDQTTFCEKCGIAGECAHTFKEIEQRDCSKSGGLFSGYRTWKKYVMRCSKCGEMKMYNSNRGD